MIKMVLYCGWAVSIALSVVASVLGINFVLMWFAGYFTNKTWLGWLYAAFVTIGPILSILSIVASAKFANRTEVAKAIIFGWISVLFLPSIYILFWIFR